MRSLDMTEDELANPPVTRSDALEAVGTFLKYIGENPDRPGLQETPERFLKAWERYWGAGYAFVEHSDLVKLFDEKDAGRCFNIRNMVIVKDIDFFSHCEHHLAPFFGKIAIAYIPNNSRVLGLSKFARITDHFSRRLQVQERLTEQIANYLVEHVSRSVAVRIEATHLCMVSRGVQQSHAKTITTSLRGDFYEDAQTRGEFFGNF